jgi:hypothetical protein
MTTKLLELGCELGQGLCFSKPTAIEGIEELLRARHMLAARDAELTSSRPQASSSVRVRRSPSGGAADSSPFDSSW